MFLCLLSVFSSSSPWCWLSCDCRLGQCMWEDLLCVPPPGASCQIGQHHEGNWFPPWQTPRHSITEAPHQLVRNSDAQQQKSYLWIPDSCTVQLVIQSMQFTHALCLSPHNITSHTLQHLHIYSVFTHAGFLCTRLAPDLGTCFMICSGLDKTASPCFTWLCCPNGALWLNY